MYMQYVYNLKTSNHTTISLLYPNPPPTWTLLTHMLSLALLVIFNTCDACTVSYFLTVICVATINIVVHTTVFGGAAVIVLMVWEVC